LIVDKEEIANLFYTFHDGDIILEREERVNQVWKIECRYLAEMINPKFVSFWIKLHNVQSIQFTPWVEPEENWTNVREIFETELEISSAKVVEDKIEINCHQHNADFDFQGGEILLDCKGIEVYDQDWHLIEYDKLRKICKDYWNKYK